MSDEPLGIDAFAAALHNLDSNWDQLLPHQQADLLRLVVKQVDFNGPAGKIAVRFCPVGIARLAADPNLAEKTVA